MSSLVRSIGAFLAALSPIAASVLLAISSRSVSHVAHRRRWLLWACAWFPIPVFILILRGPEAYRLPEFTGSLLLGSLGFLIARLPRQVVPLLWLGTLVLASLLLVERHVAANSWHPSLHSDVSIDRFKTFIAPQTVTGGSAPSWFERRWRGLSNHMNYQFELTARRLGGATNRAWFTSDEGFVLEPVQGRPATTRVTPPKDRDAYLTRRVATGGPLAERTFRATIELRASEDIGFSAKDCRGVLLREVAGSDTATCFAQEISTEWRLLTFDWTAPTEATSDLLRLELRLPVTWYEVGAVAVHEVVGGELHNLGPLEPTGLRIGFAQPGSAPLDWSGPTVSLDDSWTSFQTQIPAGVVSPSGSVRVLLRAEPGTEVQVRGVGIVGIEGHAGTPVAVPQRSSLWFDHPNLAAHALSGTSLVVASLATSPLSLGAAAAVGLFGVSATGSRTGFIVLAVVCIALLFLRFDRRFGWRWIGIAVLVGAVLAALVVQGPLASRLSLLGAGDGNQVSRSEIWEFAWREMLADPWGNDSATFPEAWSSAHIDDQRPTPAHAHNLWLQFGAEFGLPGLAFSLTLVVCLVLLSAPRRNPAITLGVLGILALQVTDYTLTYYPLGISLILLIGPGTPNFQLRDKLQT